MTIFNRRLPEYAAFAKPFMVLIVIVGIVRLALSLMDVPNSTVKWFSMNVVGWIAFVYLAVRVHSSGFGSYKHLLPIFAMVNLSAQAVAMVAIALSIFTGTDNIYSATEYAFGADGKTWTHFLAHLFVGTTIGTLVAWLIGSVIMFASKKLTGSRNGRATAQP